MSMDHIHALPSGTLLEEYRLHSVLGAGGFGITYRAEDTHLNKVVAIKEYLPSEFATRTETRTVVPHSGTQAQDYHWGLTRFLDEARALARFDHPHLNKVYRFFEANGTAYLVLEYIEGETLGDLLDRRGTLPEVELRRLLTEVLGGLAVVHEAGYVHRDVKPGNLMLRDEDGSVVLLDFGAARQAVGQRSRSVTSILTPGYAPIEQYDSKADDVGVWSDIYALGMVAYRCISGVSDGDLLDAVTRARGQRKGGGDWASAVAAGRGRYDEGLLRAIDWAIAVDEENRPQSIAQWQAALSGEADGLAAVQGEKRRRTGAAIPQGSKAGRSPRFAVMLAGVVTLALVGGGVYWFVQTRQALIAADDGAYARARSAGTVAAYGEYLQSYPAGRHAAEARHLQTEVKLAELTPGQSFRDELASGGQGPEIVALPAGRFRMGCVSGRDCHDWEKPVHEVRIAQPFALSKYEVTRGEFERFVAQAGYRTTAERGGGCYVWDGNVTEKSSARWNNPGFNQSDTHPVVCVSWDDAVAYVEWLSSETGKPYRLPGEAEWEYAARSGSTTKYHFGNDESQLCRYANHLDRSTNFSGSNESCSDGVGLSTAGVGSYQPNSFGLHDMHGNVWEWVADCWNDSYVGAPSDGSAWKRGDCGNRVLRGGSWGSRPWFLRTAYRASNSTDSRLNLNGFRVARTLAVETVTPEPVASDGAAVEAGLGLTRAERRQVQQGLTAAGFNPGLADGLFGEGTRSALRDWQASQGEAATGYLDAESAKTLLALGSEFELWESVKGSKSSMDFEGYLTQYPSGIYADEARGRRQALIAADDGAYARARSAGTVAAYGEYLRSYPAGRHAAEARRLQTEIKLAELTPGQSFRDELGSGGQVPEMVVIPAGRFRMGCVSGRDCGDGETPVHEVTIAQPFALSKYEVTRGEFGRFVTQAGYRTTAERGGGCYVWDGSEWTVNSFVRWNNPGFNQSDTHPVVCVSWDDAVAYVEWLSSGTGMRYRLPSEAEWEYAARSGSTTKYHFGDDESQLCQYANHEDGSTGLPWRNVSCLDGIGERTAEVGSYQPNSFGLHDMHGNVWEWVQDCWNESYAGAPSDGSAWTSGDCGSRVLRGGSWNSDPWYLRAALRLRGTSNSRSYVIGFRVAQTLTP